MHSHTRTCTPGPLLPLYLTHPLPDPRSGTPFIHPEAVSPANPRAAIRCPRLSRARSPCSQNAGRRAGPGAVASKRPPSGKAERSPVLTAGSENHPEAPSHKRFPGRTGLGGRASGPRGERAAGFAPRSRINWKSKGPHWASRAGQTGSASKSRARGRAASSHGRGQAQLGRPGPSAPPRSPPDPTRRARHLTTSPSAARGPRRPSTGLFLRQILIKRIPIMISGGRLAARAWPASRRPTSSHRAGEDRKSDPWQGRHIVPRLWESARCADISFRGAYKEAFVMALAETVSPAGRDE